MKREDAPLLHLTCPRQRLVQPTLVSIAVMLVVATAWRNSWSRILAGEAWLFMVVSALMMACALAILYRNFIFQDQLYVMHDGRLAPATGALLLDARDIDCVRLLPASALSGSERKMEWLGLGGGRIEIATPTHFYRFGAGFDEHQAEAAVARIVACCRAYAPSPRRRA
ncbi:hypothetical protein [Massilia sp.]|uniref:hypothetical protein n=1 Tax=Massilia sp. TaxID=1882437 RepID=UPI00289D33CF|nr:hypothetical protein [Massilia sp.]